MPAFSFHIPRFLRSGRSRPPEDPPDVAISRSDPFFPLSRLPRRQRVNPIATSPSRPSSPVGVMTYQSSTVRPVVDRTVDDSGSQPSRQATPMIAGPSSVAQTLSPHSSGAPRAAVSESPYDLTDTIQSQLPLVSSLSSNSLSLPSPPPSESQYLLPPQGQGHLGMFNQASNFSAVGTFIFNDGGRINITTSNNNTSSNYFMVGLLEETIPGAAFDSSARDPPPRCHPETRLAVLERCKDFIHNCSGVKKMRWVVGAAGVGKSAIMQSVAESPALPVVSRASVFFSINGRDDGTKTIPTLSYQFAAESTFYRQLIEQEITRDPSLLRSSMAVQFRKLIVEPFVNNSLLNSAGRVLIIIDGLDECSYLHSQIELLRLISDLCITYPSSPIVWLIASRPEPHITSFFSRPEIILSYEKEEILIDSNESRTDVERFFRHKLEEIRTASGLRDPRWPGERDFWKLSNASGGLFAYAQTVIRYIGDSTISDPVLQLSDVLNVIDSHLMADIPQEKHPMALLDALYARILSKIHPRTMINTRKLLLALASDWDRSLYGRGNFVVLCNWLGLTADEAYAAVNRLRAVLLVPPRDEAHRVELATFHKSFIDFLCDFTRSGFSIDITNEARQFRVSCTFRISKEALDGIDFGNVDYGFRYGELARGPGTGDKISITWPITEGAGPDDNELRLMMYKTAIGQIISGIESREPVFQTEFCIRLLTTRFQRYDLVFPYQDLRDVVFDEHRRHDFIKCGILREVPLEAIKASSNVNKAKFRFRRHATAGTNPSSVWNPSCTKIHEQDSEWDEGMDEAWTTNLWRPCRFCFSRLERQLEMWKARSPDHTALVMFTSTGECCVEFSFVDPEDGVSEWTYWFWIDLSAEERKQYGSTV